MKRYLNRIMLREGTNEIVLFETDGKAADAICLRDEPKFG